MIKKILLGFLCALFILIIAITFCFDFIAKQALQVIATNALNTPVSVGYVDVSLFTDSITIGHLVITNPPGYPDAKLADIDTITVKLDLSSLFSKTIHIPLIQISNPTVLVMTGSHGTNLQALMDQTKQSSTGTPTPAQNAPAKPGKTVVIDQLLIQNVQVHAQTHLGNVSTVIPSIEMDNIGKNGGTTLPQAMVVGTTTLLVAVLNSTATAGITQGIGNAVSNTAHAIQNLFKQ